MNERWIKHLRECDMSHRDKFTEGFNGLTEIIKQRKECPLLLRLLIKTAKRTTENMLHIAIRISEKSPQELATVYTSLSIPKISRIQRQSLALEFHLLHVRQDLISLINVIEAYGKEVQTPEEIRYLWMLAEAVNKEVDNLNLS